MAATYAFSFVLANFGMAMAASNTMITTTMSSSISVKPRRDITCVTLRARRGAERFTTTRCPRIVPGRLFLQEPCLTLGIDPIDSSADSYDQWHTQIGGALHMAFYQLSGDYRLLGWHLKYKLVMHLQDHARRETALCEGRRDAHHGDLDQVRRRSLQRGIGRRALAEGADIEIAIFELRHVAASSEQCLDISLLARFHHGAIEPGTHTGEAGEVFANERARFLLGNAELAGKRERSLPV